MDKFIPFSFYILILEDFYQRFDALGWSLHSRRIHLGSAIWVIACIGLKKHDLFDRINFIFFFFFAFGGFFSAIRTIANSGGEMKRCDRNASMAIKILCDYICHRPMIGIALLFDALTLHWLCGDETQCSAFVSVFGRLAYGWMSVVGIRTLPFSSPHSFSASNKIKKLKFEKTWHLTDKDSHQQQQSQRQHDHFIHSDFVIWLKKFTTNATFSIHQT